MVYTGRGAHSETTLGDLDLINGSLYANQGRFYTNSEAFVFTETADWRASECVWIDLTDSAAGRANMRCPRCTDPKVHREWRHAKAVDKLTRLHEAGVIALDVPTFSRSYLLASTQAAGRQVRAGCLIGQRRVTRPGGKPVPDQDHVGNKLDDPAWRRDRAHRAGRSRTTPEYHLERLRAAVAESRAQEGLPPTVVDDLTLGRVAALLAARLKKAS